MDWLVNLAILFVVGYFIFGLTRERKSDQSGDVLPRYTEQRSLTDIEKESKELIKRELSHDGPSYETLRSYENPYTGFLQYYLRHTSNDEKLTTIAKSEIVKTLSVNDLLQDLKLLLIFFVVLFRL